MGIVNNMSVYTIQGASNYATLKVAISNGTATSVTASNSGTTLTLTWNSSTSTWNTSSISKYGIWTISFSNSTRSGTDYIDITAPTTYNISVELPLLPNTYKQLQYVEGTGSNWSYVTTNLYPLSTWTIKGKCKINTICQSALGYNAVFMIANATLSTGYWLRQELVVNSSSSTIYTRMAYQCDNNGSYVISWDTDAVTTSSIYEYTTGGNTSIIVNGSTYTSTKMKAITKNTSNALKIYVASLYSSSSIFFVRQYYVEVLNPNGSRVGYFIPAKKISNNQVVLYDVATETFLTFNGSVVAGPEV